MFVNILYVWISREYGNLLCYRLGRLLFVYRISSKYVEIVIRSKSSANGPNVFSLFILFYHFVYFHSMKTFIFTSLNWFPSVSFILSLYFVTIYCFGWAISFSIANYLHIFFLLCISSLSTDSASNWWNAVYNLSEGNNARSP